MLVLGTVLAMLTLGGVHANASGSRPCGLGGNRAQNKRLISCLSHQTGIRVSRAEALKVANCESGFFAHADSGKYRGLFQLLGSEFDVFPHQAGGHWVQAEFRKYHYGIFSARGNTLAALAHASHYGWSAWSCA